MRKLFLAVLLCSMVHFSCADGLVTMADDDDDVACVGEDCPSESESDATEEDAGDVNTTLRLLASNIILSTAEASELDVDTTTKVLAENVVLDNSVIGVESTNVQGAFEEVEPDLTQTIVGTWDITNVNRIGGNESFNGFTADGGTVTFNEDGTVVLSCSSSNSVFDAYCDYMGVADRRNKSLTYGVVDNMFISLHHKADTRSSCSTTNCDASDQNNGNNCSCGGFGDFEDAPCVGGCSDYTPTVGELNRLTPFVIYKATGSQINLGFNVNAGILTKVE